MICGLLGDSETVSGVYKVSTIHNNTKIFSIFMVCWHLYWWCKSNGGKHCWHLGMNQTPQGHQTTLVVVFFVLSCTHRKIRSTNFHLRLSLMKQKKLQMLLNPSARETLVRDPCGIVLWATWATFFKIPVLREWLAFLLWLFRLGYMTDIFSKMNEVSLSLQEKQLTVFVPKDKVWTLKWKLAFFKKLISAWQSPTT